MRSFLKIAPAGFAALLLASVPAQAVPLAPGQSVMFRDNFGSIVTPGTNEAADPSLAGQLVVQTSNSFSMVVTREYASGQPPTQVTLNGTVDDWVVRRFDTGSLDFYSAIHLLLPPQFAGTLMRPWDMGNQAAIDASFRDDIGGNAPTRLQLATDGKTVTAQYYATDDGNPNWVNDSAPVLFRSAFSQFGIGTGEIAFAYSAIFASDSGSVPMTFFVPQVPEPSTTVLLALGLIALAAVLRTKRFGPPPLRGTLAAKKLARSVRV